MAGNFNRTNNFWPTGDYEKDWELMDLPVTESTAYEMGSAMYWVKDGKIAASTNSTANFAGILADEVASTDDDYATAFKKKQVWVPKSPLARCTFRVGAGTFATDNVGDSVVFNDEKSVAVDTAGTQLRITRYISSTKGECVFNLDIT